MGSIVRPLFLCLLLLTQLQALSVKDALNTIPERDRSALEAFFRVLSQECPFLYTLFGSKPISCASFAPPSYSFFHAVQRNKFEKGWGVWKRYSSLFPSERFILKREDRPSGTVHFYLINKFAAYQLMEQHSDLFPSPKQAIALLSDPNESIRKVLISQSVWGVLFGFGKPNAICFEREWDLCRSIAAKIPLIPCEGLQIEAREFVEVFIKKKRLIQSQENNLAEEIEELNDLVVHRQGFEFEDADYFLSRFGAPGFVYWEQNAETTSQLGKLYAEERVVIRNAYKETQFLETTLKQWCSSED